MKHIISSTEQLLHKRRKALIYLVVKTRNLRPRERACVRNLYLKSIHA